MTTTQHGFELVREAAIAELNAQARLFRHQQTGAQLLSIENDDENKVFAITFATPPTDSTGLPHIMEHSVLCGSRKYPLKEPFVELLKSSLQTFLNAFTFSDKTAYPVASQNVQDFYNLVDVYLDAVFYPNITPFTLKQEGWHYELDDLDAPLVYKGVVFNEMKGAYSDPDNVMGRYVEQSLFPDTTYGVDSGGDPEEIPDLTYEQFKQFHDVYYHPSNALIFFAGDDDPAERLRLVDAYLRDFDPIEVAAQIELQPRWQEPRRMTIEYAAGEEDAASGEGQVAVNWMLDEVSDMETALAFTMLEHILIGTPASPLRKALIDSGLGEDLAGSGLDLDLRQPLFSTGLKGVSIEHGERVEDLIMQTLQALVADGIERDMIDASVNSVEFALRENNSGPIPRGLLVAMRVLRFWLYGGDPLAPLAYEAPLAALKSGLEANPRYFENLIQQYLLDNPHRSTVILKPDADLARRKAAAEQERLTQARAAMTLDDLKQVLDDTRTLKQMQETPDPPEALAKVPSLTLDDLDKQNKVIPLETDDLAGVPVLYHDLFTNGIVYLDLGFNLYTLPQEMLPYMGLFGRVLLEMGTDTEDFVKLAQRIGRDTGGISPALLASMKEGGDGAVAWQFLRGKATVEQTGALLAILRDVLTTVQLDNQDRFRQIVLEEKATQEAMLVPRGHIVVRTRLQAAFNEADWVAEQVGGLEYLFFLRRLAEKIERDWPSVLAHLTTIRDTLVNRRAMLCNVTLDADNWAAVRPQVEQFAAGMPAQSLSLHTWTPAALPANEGLTIPAQVNYVGKGADLFALGYEPHGSAAVVRRYLISTWLWERVRVHGGAYGGFATFDPRSGAFAYLSYRDPNLLGTLANYDQVPQFLRNLDLSADELTKSIIGAIGDLDQYQLPDAKGYTSMVRYLVGLTEEIRQQYRDEILNTTPADYRQFADVLARINDAGRVVVLGSAENIAAANAELDQPLEPMRVI